MDFFSFLFAHCDFIYEMYIVILDFHLIDDRKRTLSITLREIYTENK